MARRGLTTTDIYGRDAGSNVQRMSGVHQRSVADENANYGRVEGQFGDPMHALALSNASQGVINAQGDVAGRDTLLQGLKEVVGRGRARVTMPEQNLSSPSATSPASWNPAGMTEGAAMADVQKVAKGGAMPDYATHGAPDTQEAFRRRLQQALGGLKRAASQP